MKHGSKRITGAIKHVDTYSRSVVIVASTPNPVEGEALTAWDFSRFVKNPVIFWGHDEDSIPIGKASEIAFDSKIGLTMRVTFARKEANPLAEQVYQSVIDDTVRAVSVGYDPPKDGKPAVLIETSFVGVGADEDAGTATLNEAALEVAEEIPEEERTRRRVSNAARELSRARMRRRAKRTLESLTPAQSEWVLKDPKGFPRADNPPAWVDDETSWEKAKAIVQKKWDEYEQPWAVVASIYSNMTSNGRTDAREEIANYALGESSEVSRFDRSSFKPRFDKLDRSQVGGVHIPARLSRTGVLTYINPDGTRRRELRLEEEVFKADSLRTLEIAPVIDIKDHTGMVSPETWRHVTLGHVVAPHKDGKYIAGDLVIQDAGTLDSIDRGERSEISLGYRCVLDMTPGVHEGEAYDCIQRHIRYNHAALCPPNRGRAGPDVGLRLDSNDTWAMALIKDERNDIMKVIRIDGKEYEIGSEAHIAKLEEQIAKANLDAKEAIKAKDVAEAERDTLKAALTKANLDAKKSLEDLEAAKAEEDEAAKVKKRQRRKLERIALRFFEAAKEAEAMEKEEKKRSKREFPPGAKAPPFTSEDGGDKEEKSKRSKREWDEEDEECMDALESKIDSMSDRELMLAVIGQHVENFDAKDKSDDYVTARFDSLVEQVTKAQKNERGIAGVVRAAREGVHHLDSNEEDMITQARRKRDEAAREAWKVSNNGK